MLQEYAKIVCKTSGGRASRGDSGVCRRCRFRGLEVKNDDVSTDVVVGVDWRPYLVVLGRRC